MTSSKPAQAITEVCYAYGMKERYTGFGKKSPAEREFHDARWERAAAQANEGMFIKWGVRMGAKSAITPEDVMYAEAVHEDNQFERLLSDEHQRWDRMLDIVVNDMKKVRDKASDKPEHYKAVLLTLGTGLSSGYACGQNMALEDMGYADQFDVIIGSSGASGPAAFFVTEDSRKGASMYMNECTTPEFLSFSPVPKLDTGVIARGLRSGPKALDQDGIRHSKKEIYAIAANKETKKAEFLNLKTSTPDMVSALEASSAVPFFRDSVEVDGTHYYDGAFSQIPLEEIIEKFHPTHLLIEPNVAFDYLQSYQYTGTEKAVLWTAAKLGSMASMGTVEEFFRMKENVRELLEKIGEVHNVKIAVLWPPAEGMGNLINDADTMRRGILGAYRDTISKFGEKQPERIKLFPGDMPETETDSWQRKAA